MPAAQAAAALSRGLSIQLGVQESEPEPDNLPGPEPEPNSELQLDVAEIAHTNAVALQIVLASPVVALSSTCEFLHPFTRSLSPLSLSLSIQ